MFPSVGPLAIIDHGQAVVKVYLNVRLRLDCSVTRVTAAVTSLIATHADSACDAAILGRSGVVSGPLPAMLSIGTTQLARRFGPIRCFNTTLHKLACYSVAVHSALDKTGQPQQYLEHAQLVGLESGKDTQCNEGVEAPGIMRGCYADQLHGMGCMHMAIA